MKPSWVSEGSIRKYDRAVAQLNKDNVEATRLGKEPVAITEDAIKALYIKWGGLVVGEEERAPVGEGDVIDAPAPAHRIRRAKAE